MLVLSPLFPFPFPFPSFVSRDTAQVMTVWYGIIMVLHEFRKEKTNEGYLA